MTPYVWEPSLEPPFVSKSKPLPKGGYISKGNSGMLLLKPMLCVYLAVTLLAFSLSATAATSALPVVHKGSINIQHQARTDDPHTIDLTALGQPKSVDSTTTAGVTPMAAAVPAVKANIKRIYFRNNCSCSDSLDAPYPLIALSYKPVQSADFYNIGYWSVIGCDAKYLIATTEGERQHTPS